MAQEKVGNREIRLIIKEAKEHITLYLYQSMLQELVSRGDSPDTVVIMAPSMRGYGFGYFDDIDTILRYDAIKRNGVDVMRRIDGGGCIFHDYSMGGYYTIGLHSDMFLNIDEMINVALDINEKTLLGLGIDSKDLSRVHGDIRWKDKKIGSLSLVVDKFGEGEEIFSGLSVPAFNRSFPDMSVNDKYAIIQKEKMKDKQVTEQKNYFAVLNEILNREVSLEENIDAMKRSFIEEMSNRGIEVTESNDFTETERSYLKAGKEEKDNEEWVCRVSSRRFFREVVKKGWRYGYAQIKYNKLVKCFVALASDASTIQDICIAGDIYISPNTIMDRIRESLIKNDSTDREGITLCIKEELSKPDVRMGQAHYVTPEEFAAVVEAAIDDGILNHYIPKDDSDLDMEYHKRMAKFGI